MKTSLNIAIFAFGSLLACTSFATVGISYQATVIDVVDGDTIIVGEKRGPHGIKLRSQEPVELDGLDAPELGQLGGEQAKMFLEELIKGKDVSIIELTDMGKSRGAWIFLPQKGKKDKKNINFLMMQKGLAWRSKLQVHSASGSFKKMKELEAEAREKKIGIWSKENPTPPWEWRKRKQEKKPKAEDGDQDNPAIKNAEKSEDK